MTLSTDVYVLDEVDPAEVFRFCQGLLTKYDDPRHMPAEQQRVDSTGLSNAPDQGLPAWLMTHTAPKGPLCTTEQAAAHQSWCAEDYPDGCDGRGHDRACWMSVDFDTTYGYRDSRGWGCGDLHAAIVGELGDWLTAKGVRWEWRNEFTGEVHTGRDGLHELGAQGAEAGHWYATMALPAIIAHAAGGVS